MFTPFAFVKQEVAAGPTPPPPIVTDQLAMYLDPSTGFSSGNWVDSINGLQWTKYGSNLTFVDNNYITGFDSSADYLEATANINSTINATNDAEFTYEFWWFAPTSYTTSTLARPWAFQPDPVGNEYRFTYDGAGGIAGSVTNFIDVVYLFSPIDEFEGKWVHHAMTFVYNAGGGDSSLKYYHQYDGKSITMSQTLKSQGAYTRTGYSTTGPHRIGKAADGAAPILGGSIGTMRIYNKALSQAEVEQNYNAEISRYS
jgi:hypothetical protein